jgi:multiple sugar transport system ATP-binding protein/alpha-glucoside transport system ATP-binding protein
MIEEARCRLDCGVTLELATDSGKLWKGEIGEGNGTDVTFSGAIDLVEHLREVQILYLDLPGTTEKFLIKVDGESSFARLQDIHVFDAEGNVIPVSAGATV